MVRTTIVSVIVILSLSAVATADTTNDLVFIHHSCGSAWLSNNLHNALLAKDYIDERNDITYGTDVAPDAGRPDSLAATPGDKTDMNHWILWFNDYLQGVRGHDCADGFNKIIMFKSCYPISNITADGTEPGDPFSSTKTITNYKAVYRHPDGPGNTYTHSTYTYKPLEDIFAENPDILFIPVTAPPLCYTCTTDENAHRARVFNNWLKTDWLAGYNTAHPGLNNVAVFDWFDVLAYPDDHASHPNRLKQEYGGETTNSHPNSTANADSTEIFATDPDNFIDTAWEAFVAICVSTATEIQNALTAAQANGSDDIIHVVQGTYYDNFAYTSGEGYSITLEGGYTTGCSSRVIDPANTVLDGRGLGRVLDLHNTAGGDITVEGFTLQHGDSTGNGGGVYAYSESSTGDSGAITIQTNTIIDNTTTIAGGGVLAGTESTSATTGNITITDNTLTGNTADGNGGGVNAQTYTVTGTAGAITLTGNTVTGNTSTGSAGGGIRALAAAGGTGGDAGAITLTGNIITRNSAHREGGIQAASETWGGGDSGTVTLVNNIIAGNTATDGPSGGVTAFSEVSGSGTAGIVTLLNNTITGNSATTTGGGAYLYRAEANQTVNCYNNIIWGNSAPSGGDIRLIGTFGTANGFNNDYTDMDGGWDDESGNINSNPLFVNDSDPDPVNWDLHLQQNSPCIDHGTASAPNLPTTDFEGDLRIMGNAPDMGADEAPYDGIPNSVTAQRASMLCPSGLGFGAVEVDDTLGLDLVMNNTTDADIAVDPITSPSTPPYSITDDGCGSTTLHPGDTCAITIQFAPGSTGTFYDSFQIPTDDPDAGTVSISLAGTGVSAEESASPQAAEGGGAAPMLPDIHKPYHDRTMGDPASGETSTDASGEDVQIPDNVQQKPILESLARSPKLIHPERVLDDFIAGNATTRVIVNLARPQTSHTHTHFKNKAVRDDLRKAVRTIQDTVINRTDTSRVRVTNRFTYVSGFSAEVTPEGLRELTAMDDVLSVNKDRIRRPHLAQGIPVMNAMTVRDTYNGAGLSIAICDTGIDYTHPRLGGGGSPPTFNSKVIGGWDTGQDDDDPIDGHGHGTSCAGIAAGDLGAVGDYIGGVAHNAKLYALKVTNTATGGEAYDSDIIQAWEWCIDHQDDDPDNPIMVISNSFGGERYDDICDASNPLLAAAAGLVVDAGMALFVSSGNEGYCDSISAPACLSDAISVGSVLDTTEVDYKWGWCLDPDETCAETEYHYNCNLLGLEIAWQPVVVDTVSRYTNIAGILDLLAPADCAYTTDLGGGYDDEFGGTSAACPYAAGAAACLQSAALAIAGAYLTPAEVRTTLTSTGDPITDEKTIITISITKPRIDLDAAVATLEEPGLPTSKGSVLCPSGLGFGEVQVGDTLSMDLIMNNTTDADIGVGTATIPAFPYSLTSDGCSGVTLHRGDTCAITVEFAPVSAGNFYSYFLIPTDDPQATTLRVNLSGAGVSE